MSKPRLDTPVEPVAWQRERAAAAVDVSPAFFDKYIAPRMRVVILGRLRLYPRNELERVVDELAEHVIERRIAA